MSKWMLFVERTTRTHAHTYVKHTAFLFMFMRMLLDIFYKTTRISHTNYVTYVMMIMMIVYIRNWSDFLFVHAIRVHNQMYSMRIK